MKIQEDKQTLVAVDFDWWWAVGATISFLFLAWHLLTQPTGLLVTIPAVVVWGAFCTLFLWLGTRSTFTFNKVEQIVYWDRMGITGRRGGEIPFSEIKDVAIGKEWPNLDLPTQRIFLKTKNEAISLQAGFTLAEDRDFYQAYAKIRQMIRDSGRRNAAAAAQAG